MTEQGQQWQSNENFHDLTLSNPSDLKIDATQLSYNGERSPSITFTPAFGSNTIYNSQGLDSIDQTTSLGIDNNPMIVDGNSFEQVLMNDSLQGLHCFGEKPPWNAQGITSYPHHNTNWSTTAVSGARFINSQNKTVIRAANDFTGYRKGPASNSRSDFTPLIQQGSAFKKTLPPRGTRSVVSATDSQIYPDDASGFGEIPKDLMGMTIHPNHQFNCVDQGWTFPLGTESNCLSSQSFSNYDRVTIDLDPSVTSKKGGTKKQHFCNVPDCERVEGFTSSSDLDRHKKSVHKISPANSRDKSYVCASLACKSRDKIWPRLDNFKNHCKNCHKEENLEDLVRRSEVKTEPSKSSTSVEELPSESTHTNTFSNDQASPFGTTKASNPRALRSGTRARPIGSISSNKRPRTSSVASIPTSTVRGFFDEPTFSSTSAITNGETNFENNMFNTQSIALNPPDSTYTLSKTSLDWFSADLLNQITLQLELDEHMQVRVQSIISDRINQLTNGITQGNSFPMLSTQSVEVEDESPQMPVTTGPGFICTTCKKVCKRACDLKKHEKRHTRPWVCTFPQCFETKHFGSKADWKRHENSLHFKLERYLCQEISTGGARCGKEYHRSEQYISHLKKDHGIKSEVEIQFRLDLREVQPTPTEFWCGFCKKMWPIVGESEEPWNERFDHIEEHFKKAQSMEEWVVEDSMETIVSPSLTYDDSSFGGGSNTNVDFVGMPKDNFFDSSEYIPQDEQLYNFDTTKRARNDEIVDDWHFTGTTNGIEQQSSVNNMWLSNI